MIRILFFALVILTAASSSFGQLAWIEHPLSTGYDGAWGIRPVDLDGDGDLDIITAGYGCFKVSWWENDGLQSFTEHIIEDYFYGVFETSAGDLDSDGDIDVIAVAYLGNEIAWYENDGQMNFTKYSLILNYQGAHWAVMRDMDYDGDTDIVTCALDAGDITWWENNGYPNFTRHDIEINFPGCRQIDVSDLDNDGDIDILASSEAVSQVAWYENNGSQTFQKHIILQSYNAFWAMPYDFDNDGDWDILTCAVFNNDVSWLENNGYMNFTRHVIDGNVGMPQSVMAADLDLDGDLDIMSANRSSSDITYWLNEGNINFTRYILESDFGYAVTVVPVDIEGDTDIDIMGGAFLGDKFTWWENSLVVLPGIINGTLNDEDLVPVESVLVYATGTDDSVYTDLNGTYELGVPGGNYDINFQKPGYQDYTAYNIQVAMGDTVTLDVIMYELLGPCASCIRGIVANRSGNGIYSVYVQIAGTAFDDYTDFIGRYSLENLPDSSYEISFTHPLYLDTSVTDVTVFPDTSTTLDVLMEGNGAVTGVVVDTAFQPISNVAVHVEDLDIGCLTDYSGAYVITGIVPDSPHDITFTNYNYVPELLEDIIVAAHDTLVLDTVVMEPGVWEVITWYGNLDGSPIIAPIGDTILVDFYAQSAPYVGFVHAPLATEDQYITDQLSITSGELYYPLTDWDDVRFLQPDIFSSGWHSQSLLGFYNLFGGPNPPLQSTTPIKIASYAFEIANDPSLIGDTVNCLMEGYNSANGGEMFGDVNGVDPYYPLQFFSPLYFIESAVGYCDYVVGDANNSGDFNVQDISFGVNYFKGGTPPPYECECTAGNTWFVAGDVNGSCHYNGVDITYGVAYFKGGPAPMPCSDCPPVE